MESTYAVCAGLAFGPLAAGCLIVAGASLADGTVEERQTAVKLYRGTRIIAASDPKSDVYVPNFTPAACEVMREARWQEDALAREDGKATYKCQVEERVIVAFQPAPQICPDRPGPDLQEQRTCPAGTVGTWLQDRVYSLQRYPDCWVLGDWTPAEPPAGMCAQPTVDCAVDAWVAWTGGAWSACSSGTQTRTESRTRKITTQPANGGAACPTLTETRTATQACTIPDPTPRFTKWATPNGSASSACTQSAPCTLTRTLAIAVAGDEVSVAPGVYTTACTGSRHTPAFNPSNSGTSVTQQIAFRGSGGTTTELRCASGAGAVFGTYGRRWVIWDGFYVNESRSPSVSDTGPVVVWASDWVTIKSSVIEGAAIAREDNHTGIRIEQSRDITIADNAITGIRHTSGASQNFAGVMGYDSIRVRVEDNTIGDSDVGVFPKGDHNLSGYGLGQWSITGNRITARRAGLQIGGLKTGSGYGRSEISDNVITGSGLAGIVMVAYDGISPRAIDIHHNTVTGFGAAILATTPGGSQSQVDIAIRNNVLVGSTVALNPHWTGSRSTWTEDYNLLWPVAASRGGWYNDGNTRDSLAQWRSATNNGAHSIQVDPQLTSDYNLPGTHSARTAGSDAGLIGAR